MKLLTYCVVIIDFSLLGKMLKNTDTDTI